MEGALQVVQAIGAAEDNVLDFGAPKRIDGSAAINLIEAAVETQADQYVMISSLGTGKFGWPASKLLHVTSLDMDYQTFMCVLMRHRYIGSIKPSVSASL